MIETVTISTAEYERLISAAEDLADLQVVAAYKADPKDGFSSEFVKRMLEGESLLKLWREHRGLSQSALSRLIEFKLVILKAADRQALSQR